MVLCKGQFKKIIGLGVATCLIFTQGNLAWTAQTSTAATTAKTEEKVIEQLLTLETALNIAYKNNKTLIALKSQWAAKKVEISTLEKQIKKTKEPALAVTLIQKINERDQLALQYQGAVNQMIHEVKILYYDILENEYALEVEKEKSAKLQEAYTDLYQKYLEGNVKSEVIKANRDNYKASEERQFKTLLALDQLKAKLTTQLVKVDLGTKTLNAKLPELVVDDEAMDQLYPFAVHNSVALLTLQYDRNRIESALDELNAIYLERYGTSAQWIEAAIRQDQADYESLFGAIEKMTSEEAKTEPEMGTEAKVEPETGTVEPPVVAPTLKYPSRSGFFVQMVPIEKIKDKTLTVTLLNEQTPLVAAFSKRDEAKGRVNEGYTTLQKDFRAVSETYQQLAFDLYTLRELIKTSTAVLEKLKASNLIGDSAYSEVQKWMLKVNEQLRSERVMRIKLNKSIAELDYVSSGALSRRVKLENFETLTYEIEKTTASSAKDIAWQVSTPEDYFGFVFEVQIPASYNGTHYQLADSKGVKLGEPVPLGESLKHPSLVYQEGATLQLIVYKNKEVLQTFNLSGELTSGRLTWPSTR